MFAVKEVFKERYPSFYHQHPLLSFTVIQLLRKIWREQDFQTFAAENTHLQGVDLIDQGFRQLNIHLVASNEQLKKIPETGGLIIVSNHPTGAIDGVGLLSQIYKIRQDVKLIQGSILRNTLGMHELTIEVDNLDGTISQKAYKEITLHLNNGGALIMFPAGEVSRYVNGIIQDRKWHNGFFRFAKATDAMVLPVFIQGKNSSFFYILGKIWKQLSMLWVVPELFFHTNRTLPLYIGDTIDNTFIRRQLESGMSSNAIIESIRAQSYALGLSNN